MSNSLNTETCFLFILNFYFFFQQSKEIPRTDSKSLETFYNIPGREQASVAGGQSPSGPFYNLQDNVLLLLLIFIIYLHNNSLLSQSSLSSEHLVLPCHPGSFCPLITQEMIIRKPNPWVEVGFREAP